MDFKTSKSIPVVEGLFNWPSDEPQIIGTRCQSCGSYYFPVKITCNNPDCKEKKVENISLSRHGKLYSYTVQYYPPPPPFHYDEPFKPYGIGIIELPEGLRVAGILTMADLDELKIGMDAEIVVEKLYEDNEGNEVVTYKFKVLPQKERS